MHRKPFYVSVEPLTSCIPFYIRSIPHQIQIPTTYVNFSTCGEHLRELERSQSDGQTNTQINRVHKSFSTFLENVNKVNNKVQLKIHFQSFVDIKYNVSIFFSETPYMKS